MAKVLYLALFVGLLLGEDFAAGVSIAHQVTKRSTSDEITNLIQVFCVINRNNPCDIFIKNLL